MAVVALPMRVTVARTAAVTVAVLGMPGARLGVLTGEAVVGVIVRVCMHHGDLYSTAAHSRREVYLRA